MHHLNPHKTGLAVGEFLAAVHLVWSVLIAFGWAAPIISFSMMAHRVTIPVTVHGFDFTAAIELVVVAGIVGYLFGHVFAEIWNWNHRS